MTSDERSLIVTEEWLDARIEECEEHLGECISQRNYLIKRIEQLYGYLEGYKEAREIFLTYRVNSEVRERLKRVGLERLEP